MRFLIPPQYNLNRTKQINSKFSGHDFFITHCLTIKTIMNNRILIIEDEIELSGLLKRFLIKRHYEVICVETLTKAMLLLQSHSFDAIILDNNLPDGKGIDFIPTINNIQNKPKIIAMSAIGVGEEALKAGASVYIEKPISMVSIYQLLNTKQE